MGLKKRIMCLAVGMALAASAQPSFAIDPPLVWTGGMAIISATANCGDRVKVGDSLHIAYRPKIESGEPNSALTYYVTNAAGIIKKTTTSLYLKGEGSFEGRYSTGRATEETTSGSYILTVTPATVTASTQFITFTGSITTFAGKVGCDVTVRGATARRP